MASATNGTTSVAYTYDSEGLRLTKATGDLVYHYYYADGKLVRIHLYKGATSWQIFDFFYDQNGHPYALNHKVGGVYTTYYYLTNLQGDVLGMVKADGTTVATYTYDPYGKPLTATGTFAATNPLRYRGYCYDTETGLYYLQSRYYDPTTARFLNADSFVSTGQGLLGNNMFAYCLNNPVAFEDDSGSAAKLCFSADGRIDDAPWRDHSPGGGGIPMGNYASGNDYGSVSDKFYTVRALKYIMNTDESVVLDAEYFAFYKGHLVIRTNGNRPGSFGILFITRETNTRLDAADVVRHEYGHTQQLAQLGPAKYIFCIVIPSFFEWGSDPVYYRRPWEITADIYGGVQSRSYPGYADAGFKYLENSRNIGIWAWLTIQ